MPMHCTRLGAGHTTRSIRALFHYLYLALSPTCILILHAQRRKAVSTSVGEQVVDTSGEFVIARRVRLLAYTICREDITFGRSNESERIFEICLIQK
jgi:hypothetical protein